MLDDSAIFDCAFCGEANETSVDISGGSRQVYVEDCQVCCRPNQLSVLFDAEGNARITAVYEG